jgi:signal transduction histidine kinase
MSSLATQPCIAPLTTDQVLGAVAHELRQPLSNIEAIAYYLSMVLPQGDAKIQAQLARIRELVEQSSWILSSGLRLAGSSLSPQPVAVDLEELITESISCSASIPADVHLALRGDLPRVQIDLRDGRELVDTLLMLFRTLAVGTGLVTVTTFPRPEGGVRLEIHASGEYPRGVSGAGSELALESVRRIAEANGGTFEMHCGAIDSGDPAGGIRGRLMLP